jgi:hypothetical protein
MSRSSIDGWAALDDNSVTEAASKTLPITLARWMAARSSLSS